MKCASVLLAILIASFTVSGSPTAADGPGIPRITFTAGDVYKPLSFIHAPSGFAHGQGGMVNGYLFVPFFRDATPSNGGFDFYDITDPRNPVRVFRKAGGSTGLREPHAYGCTDNGDTYVLQGTDGIEFWDFSDPVAPRVLSHLVLPGITQDAGYGGVWWTSWQAPLVYCSGNDQGLYLVDAADPSNPSFVKRIPVNSLGGFPIGSIFAVGNLLVLASTAQSDSNASTSGGRLATMDISDPRNPVLIRVFNTINGYASLLNGGKLLVAGVNNLFHVLDLRDPANVALSGSIDLGSPGGYVSFQDGYAHSGYGTKSVKVDVRGASPVLAASGSSGIADKDDNFAVPLGNMIFASNDHPAGSALLVHQAAPDTLGPSVNMVHPPNGATGQASTSRVGLTFTDEVDVRTLNGATVVVRPVGGGAVAGKYSYQQNIVNFSPAQPLQPGTTYEVVVPSGGVRDWSGNGAPSSFTSTFTTSGGSKDALLVVGNLALSAGDTALRSRLQGLGYTVSVEDDSTASAASATGRKVVVISESAESSTGVGTAFAGVAVPVVTSESGIFDDLKLTGPTLNTDFGTVAGQTQVTIRDAAHPLAAGLTGTVTVMSSAQSLDFGIPGPGAARVATLAGDANRFALFGYESGAAMVGATAPARRVAWFAEDGAVPSLTASGWTLFDAAVTWAVGPATVPPPSNQAPAVSLTAPAGGSTFVAPADVLLTADASDVDGQVVRVEFFSGATPLGTELGAPYRVSWSAVPAGTYTLTARAVDNGGATTTSSPVTITVTGPVGQGGAVVRFAVIDEATGLPVAGFDPLADGVSIPQGNFSLHAFTSPATVASVRFGFDGVTNFRMENGAPYSLGTAWSSQAGPHSVTATPYSLANGSGVAGTPLTRTFTVTAAAPGGGGGAGGGAPGSGRDGKEGCGLLGLEGPLLLALLALLRKRR